MNTSLDQNSSDDFTKQGMKAFQEGDYPAAIQSFSTALTKSKVAGNELASAEIANNLCVCYLKAGDSQKALDVTTGTDALFAGANDFHRQAIALGNQAAALEGLKNYSTAIEKYEESARIFKQTGDLDERALVLQSLSELHMKMGHHLDAMGTMQVALLNKKKPSFLDRLLKKLLQIPFGS